MDLQGHDSELHTKWMHREPEMGLVLRFVPESRRVAWVRWGALLSELRATTFELSDAQVTQAKAGWWAEELMRIAAGSPRHPLGSALPPDLPWAELARAMLEVAGDDTRAVDPDEAIARVRPLGEAIAGLEGAWFQAADADAVDATAVTVHLLAQRLLRGRADDDAARVPMNLLARHGLTPADLRGSRAEPAVGDWAAELLRRLPGPQRAGTLFRCLRAGLDREQLLHLQRHPGRTWQPGPGTVWRSWRLARRVV